MSVTVERYHPAQLSRNQWRTLQGIARNAHLYASTRDTSDIDHFTKWHDSETYYRTRIHPELAIGNEFRAQQEIHHPVVTVAIDQDRPVGFLYTANNVSGSTAQMRFMKRMTLRKNYLWLREAAVEPRWQGQGIGKLLLTKSLKNGLAPQPVSAYVWPKENHELNDTMSRLGFNETDRESQEIFGEHAEPVIQARLVMSSIHQLRQNLS